jgi:hypothetical protein
VVALARSAPVTQPPHEFLFVTRSTCSGHECLIGIKPGSMSMPEALDELEANPWVSNIRYFRGMELDSGYLYWEWTGSQPAFIEPTKQGFLWFYRGIVRWVEITTRVRLGDLWMIRGEPQGGRLHTSSASPPRVYQFVLYDQGKLVGRTDVICPMDASAYWRAPVTLRINSLDESYLVLEREQGPWQMPDVSGCG